MFLHQERVAILLLLGVAVFVIAAHMVLDTVGKRPFASPFTNYSADGELVIANGTIEQISITKTGGHMILQVDNNTVFVPGQVASGLSLQMGDTISAYGIVQTYRGKKEMLVSSVDDLRIISKINKN